MITFLTHCNCSCWPDAAEGVFEDDLIHIKEHDVVSQKHSFEAQWCSQPSKVEIGGEGMVSTFCAVWFMHQWHMCAIQVLSAKKIYTELHNVHLHLVHELQERCKREGHNVQLSSGHCDLAAARLPLVADLVKTWVSFSMERACTHWCSFSPFAHAECHKFEICSSILYDTNARSCSSGATQASRRRHRPRAANIRHALSMQTWTIMIGSMEECLLFDVASCFMMSRVWEWLLRFLYYYVIISWQKGTNLVTVLEGTSILCEDNEAIQ